MILVDTGPLVAAADDDDRHHRACVELLGTDAEFAVPGMVIAEVCYLLQSRAGSKVEAAFLRLFAVGKLVVVEAAPDDFHRMADLVERYADLPLGGTEAAVVAIAERLGVATVATLDRRHFSIVRPRHASAFTLLPSGL